MFNLQAPHKARPTAWGEGQGRVRITATDNYSDQTLTWSPPAPSLSSDWLSSQHHSTLGTMSITSAETQTTSSIVRAPTSQLTLHPSPVTTKKSLTTRDLTAPNFGNDYSNHFVHHGTLPQRWVKDIGQPFREYPKLQRLHDVKREHFKLHASPPISIQCAVRGIPHLIENFHAGGAQFDVVMISGCVGQFSIAELEALKIDLITPRPSLLYLWVPTPHIGQGRQLMEKWGFRHGEDITYMVSSLDSEHLPRPNPWRPESATVFTQTTWHCLMGLKGTLRRSTDSNLINCNTDTDVIIELHNQRKNIVPDQIYTLIENFTSMKRKLHIVPSHTTESLPVRPRQGWVIVAPDAFSVGDFKPERFNRRTLIPVNQEVNILRPRTPPSHR